MNEKFLKPYDAKETESRIYTLWEKSGFFNPDNLPAKRTDSPSADKPFTIMIAPPNITGSLHLGHSLENTLSDVLIRTYRMEGYKTLWMPGTDHAGIATQNVVEKDLKKQGISRHDLGREKFLEKIWEWKEKYGDIILGQLKKLGCSMDWSRTRFTMDKDYQLAVKTAFDHYYKKGLIYQGERVINWCIKDQTALSDLELEYVEEKSKLWHIKYPIKDREDFLIVATTRPETMLGDTAIAVNPKDERYRKLVGKMAILPIVNREIPIITDHTIDMEFGSGAVKVTPAHDMADSDMAQRNNLPFLKVINEVGKIINTNSEFDGMKIAEAREKVVAKLTELVLIEKIEDLTHNVAKCYRCGSTVEPLLSKQWFLKMKPLAERAIVAIKNGDVHYTPDRWEAISLDWLANVRDWCISRQIWWGHEIPLPAGEKTVNPDGSPDTFDTWFSSALWPFATLGWPNKDSKDLKEFYPTSVITSARDILHLWISRMIFSGLEFMDDVPYRDVIIHATILTKDGKRMSKSLGTGLDPLVFIEKYGADATRFGLMYQAFEGQEIRFNEDIFSMGRKFANKLWNITRYVLTATGNELATKLPDNFKPNDPADETLLNLLNETIKNVTTNIHGYRFGEAAHLLYDFVWHDFADIYIEQSKKRTDDQSKIVLAYTLTTILKLLHPFMPFITEEIWQCIQDNAAHPASKSATHSLLMIEPWPKVQ